MPLTNRNNLGQANRRVTPVETVIAEAIAELLMSHAATDLVRARTRPPGQRITTGSRDKRAAIHQVPIKIEKPDRPDLESAFDC